MRPIDCYYPGNRFPALSVTGGKCALNCPHCSGAPLAAMIPVESPGSLLSLAGKLSKDGALGFLLSGGCDAEGVVPLVGYSEAIRSIKDDGALKINAHVGYPRKDSLSTLVDSGIDSFSITYPINDRIGKSIFGVEGALSRYSETAGGLKALGGRVVPHVLIGLGTEQEDADGIERLSSENPESIVFIVFVPFKGTPLSGAPPSSDARTAETLTLARELMPGTKLVLGCMRPRGRIELEKRLMGGVLDGIVMPSAAALRSMADRIVATKLEGCCALYL